MIDGTYAIQMRLPDAVHGGYAVLSASGDVVTATFTLDQVGGLRQKGRCTGNEFSLAGQVNLYLFGQVKYRIDGLVAGDALKATCATDKGTFDIIGSRCA